MTLLYRVAFWALLFAQAENAQHTNPLTGLSSTSSATAPTGTGEDLHSLTLAGSHLTAQPPLLGETTHAATYTRELIRVQWRAGDPIDLYVIKPNGVPKPAAVLYLYSYPSETNRFREEAFCRNVTQNGLAAVGFVSALTGQRYHDVPMQQWFISELPSVLPMTVHDVEMILDYLDSRGDFDMDHIGIFGQGSGGSVAVLAAASDPRLRAVDVLDPWADWPDWLADSPQLPEDERSRYTTLSFQNALAPLDPLAYLGKVPQAHLRLQQALFNRAMPPAVRDKLAQALPAKSRVAYTSIEDYKQRGSDHAGMLSWLSSQLTPRH